MLNKWYNSILIGVMHLRTYDGSGREALQAGLIFKKKSDHFGTEKTAEIRGHSPTAKVKQRSSLELRVMYIQPIRTSPDISSATQYV